MSYKKSAIKRQNAKVASESYLSSFRTKKSAVPKSAERSTKSYTPEWMLHHARVNEVVSPSDCFEFIVLSLQECMDLSTKDVVDFIIQKDFTNLGVLIASDNNTTQLKVLRWLQNMIDNIDFLVNLVCKDVNSVMFVLDIVVHGLRSHHRHIVLQTCKLFCLLERSLAPTYAVIVASWDWYFIHHCYTRNHMSLLILFVLGQVY
jgi:hypothetical protein